LASTALFSTATRPSGRPTPVDPTSRFAWKVATGLGAALSAIGLGQLAITVYPAGFGSLEWEFGATAQALGSLPLPTVGLAALLAALHAHNARRAAWALSLILMALALAVLASLALHLLAAPVALRMTPAPAVETIRQTIARTTLNGLGFSLLYITGAVVSLRHLTRTARRQKHA
jgi:hypothetical protein